MKTLLLTTVLLGLVAALQAQDSILLLSEEKNLAGTWYMKALVTNNKQVEKKKMWMAYPITVTHLEGEHFEVTVTIIHKGQCYRKKILMEKTEDSRKFRHAQDKELTSIKKMSVKDHVIFYCEGPHQGKIFRMGMLMGRNPKENSQAVEEFKKFIWSKGIKQENIFILKQKEPCVPEHY